MRVNLYLLIGLVNCTHIYSVILKQMVDEFVGNELYFGFANYFNTSRKDCVWRNAVKHHHLCTTEVKMSLFSNGFEEKIDTNNPNWLQSSTVWDVRKKNIFFVHGYAGGDNSNPLLLMRDAFLINGQYNLFLIDYGRVSRAPCYVQLVYNIKYVGRCLATYLDDFRRSGMSTKSVTCVGHSMGAHVCGIINQNLRYPMKKIVGLDPALPLITDAIRLNQRDADVVHTIQTNAGYYGDLGSIGHVDICVNNGNIQPFCVNSENPNLCSHLYSLCFAAHSLFQQFERNLYAKKCSKVCPHLHVFQVIKIFNQKYISQSNEGERPDRILVGLNIPENVRGSYCLTSAERPFCPSKTNPFGSSKCCSLRQMFK